MEKWFADLQKWFAEYGVGAIGIVLLFILLVVTFTLYHSKNAEEKARFSLTKLIARVAIFGAMASILYVVELFTIKLPFFPSFVPGLVQTFPFVLAFALLCAPVLRRHAGAFYLVWGVIVAIFSWAGFVEGCMGDATPAAVNLSRNSIRSGYNSSRVPAYSVTGGSPAMSP